MRTTLLLGLVVLGALVAPLADAHMIFVYPDPLSGDCLTIELPGPHGAGFLPPCGPIRHGAALA